MQDVLLIAGLIGLGGLIAAFMRFVVGTLRTQKAPVPLNKKAVIYWLSLALNIFLIASFSGLWLFLFQMLLET